MYLGLEFQADSLAGAIYGVIKEGKVRTPDMGGKSHTSEMTSEVAISLLMVSI